MSAGFHIERKPAIADAGSDWRSSFLAWREQMASRNVKDFATPSGFVVRYRRLSDEDTVKAAAKGATEIESAAHFLMEACEGIYRPDGGQLVALWPDGDQLGPQISAAPQYGDLARCFAIDVEGAPETVGLLFGGHYPAMASHATEVHEWMQSVDADLDRRVAGGS